MVLLQLLRCLLHQLELLLPDVDLVLALLQVLRGLDGLAPALRDCRLFVQHLLNGLLDLSLLLLLSLPRGGHRVDRRVPLAHLHDRFGLANGGGAILLLL